MLLKMRARLGLLSVAEIQEMSSKVAGKLRNQKGYDWLVSGCIESEVDKMPFSFGSSLRSVMCRDISAKVSRFLLKRVAVSLGLELKGSRVADERVFVVHDFMHPWYLLEDHAGHLRHPVKEYDFWYARPHREWVNRAYDVDGLQENLVHDFETEFSDWMHRGWIEQVSHSASPIYATAYKVKYAR